MVQSIDPSLLSVLLFYTVVLSAVILSSAKLAGMVVLTHTRTQLIMSFVSGLMLGIAIFHLLPHAIYTIGTPAAVDIVAGWTMVGLLAMFLLLRVFHFHHHDLADDAHDAHCVEQPEQDSETGIGEHEDSKKSNLAWVGVAFGLTLHTMVDGVALAASMQADLLFMGEPTGFALLGIGVFLAILLHKPLDGLTISALMITAGTSAKARGLVLLVFALICPLTAAAVLWSLESIVDSSSLYVGSALAFSAGVFLCISLSDLLPEVHFHSHDRVKMTVVLLLGIGLALAISAVEPAHRHAPKPASMQSSLLYEH